MDGYITANIRILDLERCNADLDRLEAENDRLRELVRTIWLAGDFRAFLGVGELEVRMRKLGIEVDE